MNMKNTSQPATTKPAPKGVALLAREALIAMAKENVPPTPDNYKRYYDGISGAKTLDNASTAVLQRLRERLKTQDSPLLAEWETAIDVALAQRDWRVIEGLILKHIHAAHNEIKSQSPIVNKCKTCVEERSLNGILYVMEGFARNLEKLFPENPALTGQIEIVKDLLEHPRDMHKMHSAKMALTKMAASEQIQMQLGEAKTTAQCLADEFLAQIGHTGNDADSFLKEIEAGTIAMENAKDRAALLSASRALLSGTASAHDRMKENQTRLENSRMRTQSAEERISVLEEQVKIANEQAKQDYLTGLLNRRGMDEQIARMFGEGWERVTLALLDVDDFKKFNDQLGHEAGDEALQYLSEAIREGVGNKGISARMGGEEFVIVFSSYDAVQVKTEMEKLQRLLTRRIFMSETQHRAITFSAGVAQRGEEETPSQTLARADEAMYAAKQKGKNRVEIAAHY